MSTETAALRLRKPVAHGFIGWPGIAPGGTCFMQGAAPVGPSGEGETMGKIAALLLLAVMVIQIIRPLGFPGLRRRGDFWKIALAAIFIMMLTVLLRPE